MGRTTKAEAVRRGIWVPTFAGTTAEVYSNERPGPLARASQQWGGRSIKTIFSFLARRRCRALTMFIIDATALARDDGGERWNPRGGVRWQSAVGW
jgi:hypothetical protein